MLALVLCLFVREAWTMPTNGDLEEVVKSAYVDRGLVSRHLIDVNGGVVEYLESGAMYSKTVLFCHGASFSADTWQYVGVLDALAEHGTRAIAINLPGRGKTTPALRRSTFLATFCKARNISGEDLYVVAASMGGSFALPFIFEYRSVAGYVTVAGVLGAENRGLTFANPVLAIYGELDPRLPIDRHLFEDAATTFPNSRLVVFDNAPHPCYLRDVYAAKELTELVTQFVLR